MCMERCTRVRKGAQKVHKGSAKVHECAQKGAQRCTKVCEGVRMCAKRCAIVHKRCARCAQVHKRRGRVRKCVWRCTEGCAGGAGARAEWVGGAGVVGAGPVQRKSKKSKNFEKSSKVCLF